MLVVGDHAEPVNALAFSPDGRGLASASKDGRAVIWDLTGGAAVEAPRHSGAVAAIALSPTGSAWATAGNDSCVRIWQPEGRIARTFGPYDTPVCAVSFLSGGSLLAFAVGNRFEAAEPGDVRVVRVSDGAEVRRFNEPNGAWALAVAAVNSKVLAWSSGARRVTVIDLTAQDRFVFPPLKRAATALSLSPDGRWLAAGDDWSVRVGDVKRREPVAELAGHKGRVLALAFAGDHRTLLSGGGDARVITWDLADRAIRADVDWNIGRITALAVSPDGMLFAAASDRGKIVVWDGE